jgi:hypothetical protein
VIDAGSGTARSGADYAAFGTADGDVRQRGGERGDAEASAEPGERQAAGRQRDGASDARTLGGSPVAAALGNTSNVTTITTTRARRWRSRDVEVTEAGGAQSVGEVTLSITGSGTAAGPLRWAAGSA